MNKILCFLRFINLCFYKMYLCLQMNQKKVGFESLEDKQFENIPSYLLNDNFDSRWSYLYHSFDFKYMLLLCFVCRCLNKGELTESHHAKLSESAKIRQLTDEEFAICINKVKLIFILFVIPSFFCPYVSI